MEVVMSTLLPLLLVAAAIGTVIVVTRQTRHHNKHPEARPYGKRLLARTAPFIVISLAGCLWGVLRQDPALIILGGLGTAALTWEVWRRWDRPA